MAKNTIDIELLRSLLRYDPDTGALTWKARPESMFPTKAVQDAWNRRYAGKAAMTAKNNFGYLHGSALGGTFQAHRIAWAIATGQWPPQIDHINGLRTDNRLSNLRASTKRENAKNQKISSRNTSGVMGVCFIAKHNRWEATIKADGQHIYLGRFRTIEDAAAARAAAQVKHGFSERHGGVE